MADFVNASPAKRFFVEMLVRDIRLEDAILDLVDNAIDSLIRQEKIDLVTLLKSLEDPSSDKDQQPFSRVVSIRLEREEFEIKDNCGGIEIEDARHQVFRFGTDQKLQDTHLSVYGIGLKRAVLKIGRSIVVESKTLNSGFRVEIDVDEFESDQQNWQFPLTETAAADDLSDCGTTIIVSDLTEESKSRVGSGSFENDLVESIGQSYSLFLRKFVTVQFNRHLIEPATIPLSDSEALATSISKLHFDEVDVTLVAGLQRLDGADWRGHTAGWYIICNGRVVVFADRTGLTGWGEKLPSFQPKHRGFIGIALFMSENPESLPWTTTKRGVNSESAVFQFIKQRMISDARPVLRLLDRRYASVPVSSENTDDLRVGDKSLRSALAPVDVGKLLRESPRPFQPAPAIKSRDVAVTVQYRVERKKIEAARTAIGDSKMAAGRVGRHALDYFLHNEVD